MRVVLKANAKLNLTLDIISARQDGYHELEMIMQSVSLFDMVTVCTADKGIMLECDGGLPCDENNLAYRAAKLYLERANINSGIKIKIEKHIPVCGGLGGGSADCAAVLIALEEIFCALGNGIYDIGLEIGSDVPFCMRGGTMLARGRGEQLTPLANLPECGIVLVKADEKPSTGHMFKIYDQLDDDFHPDTKRVIESLKSGQIMHSAPLFSNSFDIVWTSERAKRAKKIITDSGALCSVVSGSGPVIYGVFEGAAAAEGCCRTLSSEYDEVFLCSPVKAGCEIITIE